jgi:hypothetical protein
MLEVSVWVLVRPAGRLHDAVEGEEGVQGQSHRRPSACARCLELVDDLDAKNSSHEEFRGQGWPGGGATWSRIPAEYLRCRHTGFIEKPGPPTSEEVET